MSGCRHEWLRRSLKVRLLHGDWFSHLDNPRLVDARVCVDCNEMLSLGPANDTPEALVELRAAEIAVQVRGARLSERMELRLSRAESIGWQVAELASVSLINDGERAGYLARVIHEHTPLDEREEEK